MILNRQRQIRIPLTKLRAFLSRARGALRLREESFAVCLVTNAQMARWNRLYRGKSGPTDVLSFPVEVTPKPRGPKNLRLSPRSSMVDQYLGDIAIAPAVARRNARRFGRSFEREMRILVLHGMLHLMGYDHETDTGQMELRECKLRRSLGLV